MKPRAVYLTAEQFAEYLSYDRETGIFRWVKKPSKSTVIGSIAGHYNSAGYLQISIARVHYLGHRIAWIIHHGAECPQYIDHINGNPSDNRITNLRGATNSENLRNASLSKRNKSGYKGVFYCKRLRKFLASICVNYKTHRLGWFSTAQEAAAVYEGAAKELHGEFKRQAITPEST